MKLVRASECEWAEEQIHRLLIGILARRHRSRLARHLLRCRACRQYYRDARRLPGLLASFGAITPPAGLGDYIRAACAVSCQLPELPPRRVPAAAQLSLAGVAATVLVAVLLTLSRPLGPYPAASLTERQGHLARVVKLGTSPVPAAKVDQHPGRPADQPVTVPTALAGSQSLRATENARAAERSRPRPRPRVAAGRSVARSPGMTSRRPVRRAGQRRVAALPRPAPHSSDRDEETRGAVGPASEPEVAYAPAPVVEVEMAVGPAIARAPEPGAAAPCLADAPERLQALPEAMNTTVAAHLAAGIVASALIERYLADAIAERGAELVTYTVSAQPATMAVISDAVLADDEGSEH